MIKYTAGRIGAQKPLRYQLNDLLKPIFLLKLYLSFIAIYALFEFLLVSTFGWSFMGIYQRPIMLGMFIFVGGTALHLLTKRNHGEKRLYPRSQIFLGLLVLEFVLLVAVGLQYGRFNDNAQLISYERGLVIFFTVALSAYVGIESINKAKNVLRVFIWFLLVLSFGNAISVFVRNSVPDLWAPLLSYDILYIMPLAGIYFFVFYLLARERSFFAMLLFVTAASGVILRFEKPVLVPFVAACGATYFVIFLLAGSLYGVSRLSLIKRALLLVFAAVAALLILELIVPGNLLLEYRIAFFRNYLKFNPVSGTSIGRVDGGRFYLWAKGLQVLKESPWWGQGFGPGIRSDTGFLVFPHNLVIDFLIGTGLLGVTLLLSFLATISFYVARFIDWNSFSVLKLSMMGFLIYVFSVSMVGVLWGHLSLLHVSALILGMLIKFATLDRQNAQAQSRASSQGGR